MTSSLHGSAISGLIRASIPCAGTRDSNVYLGRRDCVRELRNAWNIFERDGQLQYLIYSAITDLVSCLFSTASRAAFASRNSYLPPIMSLHGFSPPNRVAISTARWKCSYLEPQHPRSSTCFAIDLPVRMNFDGAIVRVVPANNHATAVAYHIQCLAHGVGVSTSLDHNVEAS